MIKVDSVNAPCLHQSDVTLPRDLLYTPTTQEKLDWLERSGKICDRLYDTIDEDYMLVSIEYMHAYIKLFLHPSTMVSASAARLYCLGFCELADILA